MTAMAGMHMTGANGGILSVPLEHLPGLIVLLVIPLLALLAVPITTTAAGRGAGWAVRLRHRLGALSTTGRVALFAMVLGAAVHAAIVPTHWSDSRFLAVLFALDAIAFVAGAGVLFAGWRAWRLLAAPLLGGTVIAYLFYILTGQESPDLVGLITTAVELTAALMLLVPDGLPAPASTHWKAVAASTVSVVAMLASVLVSGTTGSAGQPPAKAQLSLSTSSPAGPITWPPGTMSMEPGMRMTTSNCTTTPSPSQQQSAVRLVDQTTTAVAPYRSLAVARAAGYVPITPTGRRVVHYLKPAYVNDGKVLDAGAIESLVYANTSHGAVLVAAMYMMAGRDTGQTPPQPGGCLDEWHIHTNLCFSPQTGTVVGVTAVGRCRGDAVNRTTQPMMHVWVAPIPGGPLAVDASPAQIVDAAGRLPAGSLGFFGEREQLGGCLHLLAAGDKRAQSALAVRRSRIAKRLYRLACGHAADAKATGQLGLGRNGLSWLQRSGMDLIEQMLVDLKVQGDGAAAVENH